MSKDITDEIEAFAAVYMDNGEIFGIYGSRRVAERLCPSVGEKDTLKLSKKRTTEVYTAIHDPIMNTRISLELSKQIITDAVLFDLEQMIWRNVAKVLDIDPA